MMNTTGYITRTTIMMAGVLLFSYCKTKSNIASAQKTYDNKEYATALPLYRDVFTSSQTREEKIDAALGTADTYMHLDDTKSAEEWYAKALSLDPANARAKMGYARSLKGNEKYKEALVEYEAYKKMHGTNDAIEKEIRGCAEAEKWKSVQTKYFVVNEKALNTEFADYAPAFGKKGTLYFTSDRTGGVNNEIYEYTGKMYSDIYQVNYKRGKTVAEVKYEKLASADGLNTKYNDGIVTYDTKNNKVIYTICNDKNGKGNSCKLYLSTFDGVKWTESEVLPFCSDSFNTGQPSLNKEGTELYFSSDMPGGQGGKDLYVVSFNKKTKEWGAPVNLGDHINTEMDEAFPFIHPDGTLYFSSTGHTGMGRLDVFYSKIGNNGWAVPVNMKAPINSGGDDFSFVFDEYKETGYFSSNRDGGKGKDDIYRVYTIPLNFSISGTVRDRKTNLPVANSEILITNSRDSVKLRVRTDEKGFYKAPLVANASHELIASKTDDYYLDSREVFVSTKGFENSENFTRDFYLDQLNIEDEFMLKGIYYDVDKWDLRDASKLVLDTLMQLLVKYPKISVEIGSHTDCRSDSAYNEQLSAKRAQSVVAYLVEKNIKAERLEAKGYGESKPVNDCRCEGEIKSECPEDEHQKNRRTTFKILSKDYTKK